MTDDTQPFFPMACVHCHCSYTVEDIQDIEDKGLRQLTPGQAAVQVTDVTFLCHDCGVRHLVRYPRQ